MKHGKIDLKKLMILLSQYSHLRQHLTSSKVIGTTLNNSNMFMKSCVH